MRDNDPQCRRLLKYRTAQSRLPFYGEVMIPGVIKVFRRGVARHGMLRKDIAPIAPADEETRLRQALARGTPAIDAVLRLCRLLRDRARPVSPEIEEANLSARLRAEPDNVDLLQRLCTVLGEQGKRIPLELEERTLIGHLGRYPDRADLLQRLCTVLEQQGKPIPLELEERTLIGLLGQYPDRVDLLQRLCAVLEQQGKPIPLELDERTLIGLLRQYPDRVDLLQRLCAVLEQQGKPIPLELDERTLIGFLGQYPDRTDLLERLCAVLEQQDKPIPPELEKRTLIGQLGRYPGRADLRDRLDIVQRHLGKLSPEHRSLMVQFRRMSTAPFRLLHETAANADELTSSTESLSSRPASNDRVSHPKRDALRHPGATVEAATPAAGGGRLKVIGVGTGRDGTTSLAQMINELFDRAGYAYRAENEYHSREIFHSFCEYQETRDHKYLDALRREVADCPYECIVCNAAAPILPMFIDHYGEDLKLVHLRRANRTRCIASLKENCELFPASYQYYTSTAEAGYKRMTAFHFGEMTRYDWDRLSLENRLGWYYDKTHSLVGTYKGLFNNYLEITTESMNDATTRRDLARLILDDDTITPSQVFTNIHFVGAGILPPGNTEIAQWMLRDINFFEVGRNEVYLLEYAVPKVLRHLTGTIRREISGSADPDPKRREELVRGVSRARRVLVSGLEQLHALQDQLNSQA
jgi:hypothetical protein